jgi:hypothetical protein
MASNKRLVHRTWHGPEFIARERRANGRAIVGMAVAVAVEMKKVAHVQDNQLRPSIHAAAVESMGGRDVTEAGSDSSAPISDIANARIGETSWAVEVGSWVPYACVENNRGGAHRFADIGWELARPTFDPKLKRAWAEEGL